MCLALLYYAAVPSAGTVREYKVLHISQLHFIMISLGSESIFCHCVSLRQPAIVAPSRLSGYAVSPSQPRLSARVSPSQPRLSARVTHWQADRPGEALP